KTVITFENGEVFAMSLTTANELGKFDIPTNPMFKDAAIASYFNNPVPNEVEDSLDDKWRKFIFPDKPAGEFGTRYIEFIKNNDGRKGEFSKSRDTSDIELLKDKKFKEFLLKSEKPDNDVGPFFGLKPAEETSPSNAKTIPDRRILSSLFTDEEI